MDARIWSGNRSVLRGSVRGKGRKYVVQVHFSVGATAVLSGVCSCPVGVSCKHVAALLVEELRDPQRSTRASAEVAKAPPLAPWRGTIREILPSSADTSGAEYTPLALLVELQMPWQNSGRAQAGGLPRLSMKPLRQGKNSWVKTGATWDDLDTAGYAWNRTNYDPAQVQALLRLRNEAGEKRSTYFYAAQGQHLYLDAVTSDALWDAWAGVEATGVPVISEPRGDSLIDVLPAEWRVDIRSSASGIVIQPELIIDGTLVDHSRVAPLGVPPLGLFVWPEEDRDHRGAPTLGKFSRRMPATAREFIFSRRALVIPPDDVAEFVTDHFARFADLFPWVSSDGSFEAPPHPRAIMGVSLTVDADHQVAGEWWIRYDTLGAPARGSGPYRHALHSAEHPDRYRDIPAERELHEGALEVVAEYAALLDDRWPTRRLRSRFQLPRSQTIDFVDEVVPRLEARGVVVEHDQVPRYREAKEDAVIHLGGSPSSAEKSDRDWFDLVVRIIVDGQEVPFQTVLIALATGHNRVILPDGLYFNLDDGRFDTLRTLIDEARLLDDHPGEQLRLSRFQATLWDDLAELGIVDEQAQAWREAAATLRSSDELTRQAVPDGFSAELRAYQHDGYDWMSFLGDHGLGGILADDMGLGKTVQALAFMARQRLASREGGAFLVVAPTSVVGNWVAEATKFTPGLKVLALTETRARRKRSLDEMLAEQRDAGTPIDIVVTSYAIFRLDFEDYSALPWSGLVMDEAQFLKNHQSVAYQCARKLDASIKLAITGTPLENNLMELWSLTSIVAPGLFPSPKKFAEYYAKPIEREGDVARLEQLKRRIRPIMLRRTKEQVATDLPSKQEQVLEIELNSSHRKVYDTYLARERQKVLGLVDDLNANRFEIFRSLTLLRKASLDVSLVDPKHSAISSTKLDVLDALVSDIVAEGHRVLVFSQFTSFLDRARQRLANSGVDYAYLDGRTRNRAAVIERFRTSDVPVFFISLKAGGFGLNLTEADYCILLDPWWNPAAEAQAVDRTHRIGQTRNVMVYRLVSEGTIEEKVMALKATKSQLFSSVMADGPSASTNKISAQDIRALLE
ncbi:MAG: SNF2-related protein [Rhodoglobus sp.]